MTQAPSNPLNFAQVEEVRRQMLITTSTMAKVFGVSRMTYFKWVKGEPMHKTRIEHTRSCMRKVLAVVMEHNWPTPEVAGLTPKERGERLLALIAQYQ